MKHKSIFAVIVLVLSVALVGTVAAQSNKPEAAGAAITTKFTHQGKIERSNVPFTGACDMRFTLWDAAAAGNQMASYTPPTQVQLINGVFTVEIDFGMQFTGEARWLQPEAKCADDVDYTNLERVPLNPTPYAIGLMPGAQTIGSLNGTGGIIRATNTGAGAALVGLATSGTGTTYGVLGNAFSPNGYAVWGYASGGATGVQGVSAGSGNGVNGSTTAGKAGIYGLNTNTANYSVGVMGVSDAANTYGVYGGSVNGTGIWGKGALGPGVVGASDSNVGVWGDSLSGEGVRGVSHNANHGGVVGINDAAGGIAVYGSALSSGYAAWFNGKTKTKILEITGGADLAEHFATAEGAAPEPGTVMIVDEDRPGQLKVSDTAYDGKVVGIVSGAGGVNTGLTLRQDDTLAGDLIVAIAGRVYCKAEAHSAPIKPGDLLTTSTLKGHCMQATDRDQAYGAVIGKALTGLDKDEGLVLVIVNLQ